MSNKEHQNPYVSKFSKAFNLGLALSVFAVLVLLSLFFSKEASASTEGNIPVSCFSNEVFYNEVKSGELKLVSFDKVTIKVQDEYLAVNRFVVQSSNGNIATVLQDTDGMSCIVFVELAKGRVAL